MKLSPIKPNKYGTIRRKTILNYIKAGRVAGKCEYRLTDDYAWDNADNFGKTNWMLCRLKQDVKDFQHGFINFDESDFSSRFKTGGASLNKDGTIRFSIHSNLCYTLKIIEVA